MILTVSSVLPYGRRRREKNKPAAINVIQCPHQPTAGDSAAAKDVWKVKARRAWAWTSRPFLAEVEQCSDSDSTICEGILAMKNVYEVLRQKESALARVRGEIEALRYVIPLLAEPDLPPLAAVDLPQVRQRNKWPLRVGEAH